MIEKIVEIAEESRYLSLCRGFMRISSKQNELGRVPLNDISLLLISARSTVLSKPLLVKLAKNGVITVLCGSNFQPVAMINPIFLHYESAGRVSDQLSASLPLRKQLWRSIVSEKLKNQAKLINLVRNPQIARKIKSLSEKVSSGDKENREAQGARLYWRALFGEKFRRNPVLPGINSLLNYAYAVLRGAAARAVCASGFIPACGISHRSRVNSFALADDLMEPFRPLADYFVFEQVEKGTTALEPPVKQELTKLICTDLITEKGRTPLSNAMHTMAFSLTECFSAKKNMFMIPQIQFSILEEDRKKCS